MTPTELVSTLCRSEFDIELTDFALPTEWDNGEVAAPPVCLVDVSDVTILRLSSRLARSSSSKKTEDNKKIYLKRPIFEVEPKPLYRRKWTETQQESTKYLHTARSTWLVLISH